MPFATALVGPVFFVRWAMPRLADVPRVAAEFNRAYEKVGESLVYVAIVPEDSPPPDEATRKSMTSGANNVLDRCVSMHLVLEGEGFRHAILRNVVAGMVLLGGRREKLSISRTIDHALDEALRRAPAEKKFDKQSVLLRASKLGVVGGATKGFPGAAGRSH
jgi:hypothetical protein